MKKLSKDLKKNATKIINHGEKETIPLRKKKMYCVASKKFVIYAKTTLVLKMRTMELHPIKNIP